MAIHELTKEGYEKLKKRLRYLKEEKYKEVNNKVAAGRRFCDFNEDPVLKNSVDEFMALKKEINDLEYIIHQAKIVENVNRSQVGIGSLVTVKDMSNEEEIQFKIVSSIEADMCENCISEQSPVGKQLMGRKLNDQVEVITPSGVMNFLIAKIE